MVYGSTKRWEKQSSRPPCGFIALAVLSFPFFVAALPAQTSDHVEVTWLWHLHQPIYWPAPAAGDARRYEFARDTIEAQNAGRLHPTNSLSEIFGKDDRVAIYQYRGRDSIQTLLGYPLAGVQVNYSGSLIQNVGSLGAAGLLNYTYAWKDPWTEALGWTASTTGKPRLDIVRFGAHHGLLPLLTRRTVAMELAVHREALVRTWGEDGARSRGFFPTETCFSERLIPALVDAGIEWCFVPNNHLSRACEGFPLVLGTGGENCDPPNRADQVNPVQEHWWRLQISRGCSPANAAPFAALPHWAQYVDPATGSVAKIQVVPTDQALGWLDGYQCVGADIVQPLRNAPSSPDGRPPLVVLAHDGDNAFAGGYDYYTRCVPELASALQGAGDIVTTIENYLLQHPTPPDDLVHVENGGWVNADGDFGSPTFVNWNYPLLTQSGQIDPVNGWHEKVREQAIFLAIENALRTVEDATGQTPRPGEVLQPTAGSTPLERGWHFYLGAIDSGNTYFGTPGDMEVRGTIGCNAAWNQITATLDGLTSDSTGPSIFALQRHPYNPGSVNFGVQYGYQVYNAPTDFTVWTFVDDVSGIQTVTLKYRVDNDGVNPTDSTQNETYAGGSEVGPWTSAAMAVRAYPKGDPYNRPGIDYYVLPQAIADHASATVTGLENVLVDYYVEAMDTNGNVTRSDISHVWIGSGPLATPTPTPGPSPTPGEEYPWVIDGLPEPGMDTLTSNGLSLYASVWGQYLYVATDADSANGNDHFILIARQPGAMRSAPWAKAGQVAAWDYFLAREGANQYTGWYDINQAILTAPAFVSGLQPGQRLEGVMDMLAVWPSIPPSVQLCAVAYETNDGGALIPFLQAPAPVAVDGDIQSSEFYELMILPQSSGFLVK